jgi:hypothetical protein
MFARFRQTPHRLQVSIAETLRVDGKVRHEHIGSLGSIETPPSVADRIAFWQRVNERLARLSNRIDPATQGKIRGDVHARIPMVTADEQRDLQLANAEADEKFWSSMHDMHASTVEDHKGLGTIVERAVADGQAAMAKAANHRDTARARRERLVRGEDVPGGLGKGPRRQGRWQRIGGASQRPRSARIHGTVDAALELVVERKRRPISKGQNLLMNTAATRFVGSIQ